MTDFHKRNRLELEADYALKLAKHFHASQLDKAGAPYIQHLIVTSAYAEKIANTPQYHSKEGFLHKVNVVSLLHDLLEDTSCDKKYLQRPTEKTSITIVNDSGEELSLEWIGFDNDVIEAIETLTKPKEGYDSKAYYSAVKANPLTKVVKMADLIHNSDLSRGLRNNTLSHKDIARTQQYLKHLNFLLED